METTKQAKRSTLGPCSRWKDFLSRLSANHKRNKKRFNKILLATLYHEAGHVVAGIYYGHNLESVGVLFIPNSHRAFHASTKFKWNKTHSERILRERLVVLYAGLRAERLAQGKHGFPIATFFTFGSSDISNINNIVKILSKGDLQKQSGEYARARKQTLQLFKQPAMWKQIENIVSALIDHPILDSEQVKCVLVNKPITGLALCRKNI